MALMRIVQILTKQMSTWTIQTLQLTPLLQQIHLQVLAEVAQSQSQSSLPDVIGEQNGGNGGADCPFEDDEEMPPLEDANSTEL